MITKKIFPSTSALICRFTEKRMLGYCITVIIESAAVFAPGLKTL